jgi:hypothetical protein
MAATLIKTNDGLIGWKCHRTDKMIWCKDMPEALHIGFHLFKTLTPEDRTWWVHEVTVALRIMAENRHDQAEFGVFGSFMYSTESEAA